MRVTDDFRTKWGVAAAMLLVSYVWIWIENPAGRAEMDRVAAAGVIFMFSFPGGLGIAVLSAGFGSRSRIARLVAWLAVCMFGIWHAIVTAAAAFAGPLFYCETRPGGCRTDFVVRVIAGTAGAVALAACVLVEGRLRKRWAASGPS